MGGLRNEIGVCGIFEAGVGKKWLTQAQRHQVGWEEVSWLELADYLAVNILELGRSCARPGWRF
jgi:hypothetical protein